MSAPVSLKIEVIADLICPWCFIGTRRVLRVLSVLSGVQAELIHRPFLLDPSLPEEGVDLRERLRARYGADPEPLFERVETEARETGIPLDFSKVRRSVSTIKAHTLLRYAIPRGTQPSLSDALYNAYFLEGRDISQLEVLKELGPAHGFSAPEVEQLLSNPAELKQTYEEATAAAAAGIQGVPFFLFGDQVAVSGAQTESVFLQAVAQAAQQST